MICIMIKNFYMGVEIDLFGDLDVFQLCRGDPDIEGSPRVTQLIIVMVSIREAPVRYSLTIFTSLPTWLGLLLQYVQN